MKGRGHSEGLGVGGKIILEWIAVEYCGKVWGECIWLMIGTSDGIL